jgi:hypothetical protein
MFLFSPVSNLNEWIVYRIKNLLPLLVLQKTSR